MVFEPALMLTGKDNPDKLKPAPEALAAVIVNVALPGFESVMVCCELLPTLTLPNTTLAGLIVN